MWRHDPDGPRLFNSILGIDHEGRVRFAYDKRRLVPFGEYLPLEWLFRPLGIRQLAPVPRGFFFGRDPGPHQLEGLPPFEAFVCYEIVFDDPPPRRGARVAIGACGQYGHFRHRGRTRAHRAILAAVSGRCPFGAPAC